MNILTIIGARPQFIKAAAVSRAIRNDNDINEVLLHTGQHFDDNMSKVFFDELQIPLPKYNLGIAGGNHGEQTGKMLTKIEEVLMREKPNWVLVYGDTNSTLAGALAAAKLHIPVAHVEAGLRSFNKKMPEEINRILTDNVSKILFTPTKTANLNLSNEGFSKSSVHLVGDVMYDAALFYSKIAENKSKILEEYNLMPGKFSLCTIHRAENTDVPKRLTSIFNALEELATYDKLVLPLHPRTKSALENINYNFSSSKISFIEPVGYLDMVNLEKNSNIVVTDSGGVQKEAFFHEKPCLTLRDETEWVELVELGFNKLWKLDMSLQEMKSDFLKQKLNFSNKLYGDGNTSDKIVKIIKQA